MAAVRQNWPQTAANRYKLSGLYWGRHTISRPLQVMTRSNSHSERPGDLLNSKWGSGHVNRVMVFRPANFQLTMHFHSRLRVRYETDGQTGNGRQCIYASTLWRRCHNNSYTYYTAGNSCNVQVTELDIPAQIRYTLCVACLFYIIILGLHYSLFTICGDACPLSCVSVKACLIG